MGAMLKVLAAAGAVSARHNHNVRHRLRAIADLRDGRFVI